METIALTIDVDKLVSHILFLLKFRNEKEADTRIDELSKLFTEEQWSVIEDKVVERM